jgi:hypothetical protein
MSGHASSPRSNCLNCGAPLSGPYCAACGQHDVDYNQSFWHVLEDALEGVLHFDGKFFKSARYIFTRPGFLTTEFIAGRRVRYANPVRFYFFASFLLFAVSVLTSHKPTPAEKAQVVNDVKAATGNIKEAAKAPPAVQPAPAPKPPPGIHFNTTVEGSWLDDPFQLKLDDNDKVSTKAFTDEFWHLLPVILFFCLPLLALVLKLVYLGSGRLYVEHLIFALHIQALAFLSFIVIKAGGALGSLVGTGTKSTVGTLLVLGMYYLIFRAFRTVYGQGRFKTLVKLLLVFAAYGLILIFAFAGVAAVSIYLVARNA